MVGMITTLLKKGLTENSSNEVIGMITTLLKKGLTENSSNDVVGVINRRNGCRSTVAGQSKPFQKKLD